MTINIFENPYIAVVWIGPHPVSSFLHAVQNGGALNLSALGGKALKLAVFTVMLPDLSPEQAAFAVAEAGYDGLEWRMTRTPKSKRSEPPSFWGNNLCTLEPTPEDAARARGLAEQHGLELPNLGSYVTVGDLKTAAEAMTFAAKAGIPSVRIGVGALEGSYRASFETSSRFLEEVAALAERFGVRALVETHHDTICPSASLAYRLVSRFDPAHVGVIYDPGNMVYEGFESYPMGLELLGAYLAHVHLKNAAFERPEARGVWRPRWAPLEDGVVDMDEFLAALREVGYDGWLSVEDFSRARGSRETLLHDARFLKGKLEPVKA